MKIINLFEKSSDHAVAINNLATIISDYIKNDYLPHAKSELKRGVSLSGYGELRAEWMLLNGYPLERGGTMDGEEVDGYRFNIGKIGDMIPKSQIKDDDKLPYEASKDILITLAVLPPDIGGHLMLSLNKMEFNILNIFKNGKLNTFELKSTLAHEIRHALDKKLSKGKAFTSYVPMDAEQDLESDVGYLTHQTEAGARFAQVQNDIINRLKKEKGNEEFTKKRFLNYLNLLFNRHFIKKGEKQYARDQKQMRRFYSRALDLYDRMMEK